METQEYDAAQAKAFILEKFTQAGDFLEIVNAETLAGMISDVMAFDEAYMHASGADEGAVYDDDDAYDFMHEKMGEKYSDHKMYMMRFVEDYMEFNEQYLDSIGAIDWE